MDATTLRRVCRLDNPDIALWLRLLQLLVVSMEVMELIRQNVRIRYKVELGSTKSFLHFDIIVAKSVFSGNFIAHREMVDSLELV